MLLNPTEAESFVKLHSALMCFVNQRLEVVDGLENPRDFRDSPEDWLKVRALLPDNLTLIDEFVSANPFGLSAEELAVVASWRHLVAGKFFVLRNLQRHTIFLATESPPTAYGVLGLTQPFEDLLGPYLPVWTETMLLPFGSRIVYDGLLESYSISFGPGIRGSLNESYKEAKARLGIVTSLPPPTGGAAPRPRAAPSEGARKRSTARERPTSEADEVVEQIDDLVAQFCQRHLNEEYAALCAKLTRKLARKRPSPLLSGRPNTWACAIVRTIGWLNHLDDRGRSPHMKLTYIDKEFGVAESTAQGKSLQIRRLFKLHPFDLEWALESRKNDQLPSLWQ